MSQKPKNVFAYRGNFVYKRRGNAQKYSIIHASYIPFRLEILKIHALIIAKHGEIDYEAIVKLSDNFNGADLRNVCTEAGLFAIR